ncbi:hypothetical protein EJ05DRAFT_27524 [Pseudovirgaria hyperparasitica]|uniref:SET domain-containing protein n=1 Tax=Pseudovirgaria hyperparasitica TaxID=470096 RepID=A0A6A6WLQ9_9PEZI|nr:uncharacterized protein EJ05DRAFT_27524 [Pseudovirgaria hyperparasitica]KAF2763144.1 hypothetical protein EJ05DRAFT_27524 [Pseudovirgaria hyperparasitica]
MTDISSIRPHADSQLTSVAPLAPYSPALANGHAGFDTQDVQDTQESYTIKCICGFEDDDGNTVLCEKCNSWQHIACYYGTDKVPEVHECNDCLPRKLDASAARDRQRTIRDPGNANDKKIKKPASKSHKKKGKESISTIQINGWAHDKNDHFVQDRKSGSPRDQPPTKRQKSSHKPSPSVPSLNNASSIAPPRKRAGSTLVNGQSPVKSPPTPQSNGHCGDYFSSEFLQLYRGEPHTEVSENRYEDIQMPKDLLEWLEDPETLAQVTDGKKPQEVFQRLEASIQELDSCAPRIDEHSHEDTDTKVEGSGLCPIWRWLTVEDPVAEGHYIGELRGRLERKERYISDPLNRWHTLRHPEPFVFIPPYLPLAIDTRKEGTMMRYVRRSCDPNVELRTFIADRNYHFCFISLRDLQAGEVLTVKWDLDTDIARRVQQQAENGNVAVNGIHKMEDLSRWATGALKNFGGCACGREAVDCLLERAHRTDGQYAVLDTSGRRKPKKGRKQQISPISTGHATNSRAGSEAIHRMDLDDDNADTRSTYSSSRSKPASRDNTPMTAHSLADGNAEPTDRETRKMLALIRSSEQHESEQNHGNKRKKRNSGGSTLNTPSVSSSKQIGQHEPSPPTRRPVASRKVPKKPAALRVKPRPPYHDQEVQTDEIMSQRPSVVFKPFISPARAQLTRAREERLRREELEKRRAASMSKSVPPSPGSASSNSKAASSPVQDSKSSTTSAGPDAEVQDTEMKDADADADAENQPIPVEAGSLHDTHDHQMETAPEPQAAHPQIQPPPPPWEPKLEDSVDESKPLASSQRPSSDLHVELPTPEISPQPITTAPLTATPASLAPPTGPVSSQSPSAPSQPPVLSPSVSNAVAPSPARKKLSLSDYTSRKAKAQAAVVANKIPELPSSQSENAVESSSLSPATTEPCKDVEMKDVAASPSEPASTDMAPPKAPASHPPPPLFSG